MDQYPSFLAPTNSRAVDAEADESARDEADDLRRGPAVYGELFSAREDSRTPLGSNPKEPNAFRSS